MRKLVYFTAAAFFLFAGCEKNELSESGRYPSDMARTYHHCDKVIEVLPDKNGGDDTDALMAAITSAEQGSVIKLAAGEYHAGYMELYGFHGSIVGAGCGKTTIILKPSIDKLVQNNANKTEGWWRLIGGDIVISDITFKTPDGFLSDEGDYNPEWGADLYALFMVNNYNDEYYHPEEPPQKLLVKNCNFIGGINTDMSKDVFWINDYNVWLAFWIGVDYGWPKDGVDYPLTKGDYVFQNCKFEHFLAGAEGFSLGEEAKMEITKCKLNNCMWPLWFIGNYNSKIYITDNIFTNSQDYDVFIEDIDYDFLPNTEINPIRNCSYVIEGNQFNESTVSSIFLCDYWIGVDPDLRLPMKITIKGNQFNLSGSGSAITALNSQGAVIKNNCFKGTCDKGMLIDGATQDYFGFPIPLEVYANNLHVLGNNFNGLEASTADIVLGEKSSNCTIVGNGKESVVDNGTDNKIVAMKHKYGGYHPDAFNRHNFKPMHGIRPH
jgi:hypothetical protein